MIDLPIGFCIVLQNHRGGGLVFAIGFMVGNKVHTISGAITTHIQLKKYISSEKIHVSVVKNFYMYNFPHLNLLHHYF